LIFFPGLIIICGEFNMKITGGIYKGRKISIRKDVNTRPITSKVLQAIFDILGDRIIDSYFLDLFSGTGIVGIEAISRGARKVYFIDIESKAISNILYNLKTLKHPKENSQFKNVEVWNRDVFRAVMKLSEQMKFDIIFADPPFFSGMAEKILDVVDSVAKKLLSPSSLFILRKNVKESIEYEPKNLILKDTRRYGKSEVLFYSI